MLKEISVKRLTVGMHVSLKDVPWFKHPFLRTSFVIESKSEIRDILGLGRKTVLYDPEKSRSKPLGKEANVKVGDGSDIHVDKSLTKNRLASELRKRRRKFQVVEQEFQEAQEKARSLMQGVLDGSVAFCEDAKAIAGEMAKTFIDDVDLCVEHINVSAADDGQQFHALNVMVLSLMLGKQLGLDKDQMSKLAFGALSHDFGMLELPKPIRIKSKLTKGEMAFLREHPKLGVNLLSKMPDIDREVMKIVYQHHEECNGTGYPKGLGEEGISSLAKIVSLVDVYDRMINTKNPELALSPHKALAYLYTKKKACYDEACLTTFIKMLGVYPPGTVCRFTSGDLGVIMSVDPVEPLHPEVIIYDPTIPKHDAIIYKLGIDLDIQVKDTLSPRELDSEAFNYLNSRTNIQYFPSPK